MKPPARLRNTSEAETGIATEAVRQSALLAALWGRSAAGPLKGLQSAAQSRGLSAYQAHAGAAAERALAARYPTIQALLGEQAFGQLARALWHVCPPGLGDLARWGDDLPQFMADDPQLQGEAFLPDCARLDALVAAAEGAADVVADLQTLRLLGSHDPAQIRLRLAPGTALLCSAFPVASIWQAHQPAGAAGGNDDGERGGADADTDNDSAAASLDRVRRALKERRGEGAWVVRRGWRVVLARIDDPAEQRFLQVLLAGADLAAALAATAPSPFDFERWLLRAIGIECLLGAELI